MVIPSSSHRQRHASEGWHPWLYRSATPSASIATVMDPSLRWGDGQGRTAYLPTMPRPKPQPGLPSKKQILDFIAASDIPAGKREIARGFGLHGQDKIALKALLKDMADEGLIDSAPGRAFHKMGGLPKVTVLRVAEVDDGGNAWGVPEQWHAETPAPKIRLLERGRRGALAIGDRVLARTEEKGQGFVAHPMKKLQRSAELVLGVV